MFVFPVRTCRVCGCTDNNACVNEKGPCSWANEEHDLCSACVNDQEKTILYSKIYYVLNQCVPEVEAAVAGEVQNILEKLVQQDCAVKQPEPSRIGKSFIGLTLMENFFERYESDPLYTKYEVRILMNKERVM
ncbi:hypothetical protein EJP82_26775 [Paenibacillus anaericanus]|uniref:Uncharacterized protein n=1 Tax=Paenibacillus anaericanus TaxID=170367 RepID=A0A3S1D7H4_9BACL|nr:hypothetical protein [Paenibacillus anaericanus]RUT38720.1 hypothetical protein EJP82_26775 [Paenibacillus anaericanus]